MIALNGFPCPKKSVSRARSFQTVAIRRASLAAPISDDDSNEFGQIVGDEDAQTRFELFRDKNMRDERSALMEVALLLSAERDLQEAYIWVEEHRRGKEQFFLMEIDNRCHISVRSLTFPSWTSEYTLLDKPRKWHFIAVYGIWAQERFCTLKRPFIWTSLRGYAQGGAKVLGTRCRTELKLWTNCTVPIYLPLVAGFERPLTRGSKRVGRLSSPILANW